MSTPIESDACLGCEGTGSFCGKCGDIKQGCACRTFAEQTCDVCSGSGKTSDDLLILLDDDGPCGCTGHEHESEGVT